MQMPLNDYYDITLSEFFNKLTGFYQFEKEKQQQQWERMNFVAYSMLINNPYIKSSDKPKTFEDYLNRKKPTKYKLNKQQFEKLIDG